MKFVNLEGGRPSSSQQKAFERDFQALVLRHGIAAAFYVPIVEALDAGLGVKAAITGGHADVCDFLDVLLHRGADALALELGSPRPPAPAGSGWSAEISLWGRTCALESRVEGQIVRSRDGVERVRFVWDDYEIPHREFEVCISAPDGSKRIQAVARCSCLEEPFVFSLPVLVGAERPT